MSNKNILCDKCNKNFNTKELFVIFGTKNVMCKNCVEQYFNKNIKYLIDNKIIGEYEEYHFSTCELCGNVFMPEYMIYDFDEDVFYCEECYETIRLFY